MYRLLGKSKELFPLSFKKFQNCNTNINNTIIYIYGHFKIMKKKLATCLLFIAVGILLYNNFKNHSEETPLNIAENFSVQILNDEQMNSLSPLKVNSNGQTYGPYISGADLVAVISDDGKEGYILRSELETFFDDSEIDSPEKAKSKIEKKGHFTVYEYDGTTIIGYFSY